MRIILISILLSISTLVSGQDKKIKRFEGSIMVFTDTKGKIGIGGVTPNFFKINLNKNLSVGTSLAPIIWFDIKRDVHSFGTAGFVIRADYKRISVGYNILTIAGRDTKFIGLGIKL